jgi:hypothetical protein
MQKFANIPGVIYPDAPASPRPAAAISRIPRGWITTAALAQHHHCTRGAIFNILLRAGFPHRNITHRGRRHTIWPRASALAAIKTLPVHTSIPDGFCNLTTAAHLCGVSLCTISKRIRARGLTPTPILLATPGDQPHRHSLITLEDLEKLRTA